MGIIRVAGQLDPANFIAVRVHKDIARTQVQLKQKLDQRLWRYNNPKKKRKECILI
jgi:hypothetical protein